MTGLRRSKSFKAPPPHTQIIDLLRASNGQGVTCSSSTSWLSAPLLLPPLLNEMSRVKEARNTLIETETKQIDRVIKLDMLEHGKMFRLQQPLWNKSITVSPQISRMLWRTPDSTPNVSISLQPFRQRFIPRDPHQKPWRRTTDFPNIPPLPSRDLKRIDSGTSTLCYA